MSDDLSFDAMIHDFKSIWFGLELWQQIVVGGLFVFVLILNFYHKLFVSNTKEYKEQQSNGPLARLGWSNSDIKLAAIGSVIFVCIIIGAQFIV